MTVKARIKPIEWNELTDKEWNAEFEKSRHLVVSEIIDLFERRPELGSAFEIDEMDIEDRKSMEIVWKADRGVEAHSHRPVRFSISQQRRDRYSHYKPYNGVVIKVMASWNLSRHADSIRDQKYGLRKDGTHNLKAIGKRIEKILDAAVYEFESGLMHEAWKADFDQRLASAHPEFVWDRDHCVDIGESWRARIEIEAQSDFETEGFNIDLHLNGLTMVEIRPLIALVEKYTEKDDEDESETCPNCGKEEHHLLDDCALAD